MSKTYKCYMTAITSYSGSPGNGMTKKSTNDRQFGITSAGDRYGVRMEFSGLANIPDGVTVTGMVLTVKRTSGGATAGYTISNLNWGIPSGTTKIGISSYMYKGVSATFTSGEDNIRTFNMMDRLSLDAFTLPNALFTKLKDCGFVIVYNNGTSNKRYGYVDTVANQTCYLTVTTDETAQTLNNITISPSGYGTATKSKGSGYTGDTATLTATPAAATAEYSYAFSKWSLSGGGSLSSTTANPTTFRFASGGTAATVTATFTRTANTNIRLSDGSSLLNGILYYSDGSTAKRAVIYYSDGSTLKQVT